MIMSNLAVKQEEKYTETESSSSGLNYSDRPAVQKLLDTIAIIIADEYVEKAKQNPEIFIDGGKK